MKKIRIPRLKKHRSFAEKFGRDTAFFGSREKHEPTDVGSVPFLLLCMLGAVVLTVGILFLGKLWKVQSVHAEDGQLYTAYDVLKAAAVEVAVVRVVPYRFEMYDTDFVKLGYDVRQIVDKEA